MYATGFRSASGRFWTSVFSNYSRLSALLAVLFFSGLAWGAPVGQGTAGSIAQNWAYLHGWHLQEAGWIPASREAEPQVEFSGELKDDQSEVVAYKYRFPTGGEVVIVNEDGLAPVFFYSETDSFDPNANATTKYLFEELIAKIKAVRENQPTVPNTAWITIPDKTTACRTSGMNSKYIGASTTGPLVKTTWSQSGDSSDFPTYEYYCPIYDSEHCIVGCVATAMAQIMRYWNYPDRGQGSISYVTRSLEIPVTVSNFGEPAFDWANMPLALTTSNTSAQIQAVARLGFYCGASVQMNYTPWSSGAYSEDVVDALVGNFKYPSSAQLLYRYETPDWDMVMRDQILKGQPVYYAGSSETGGHAFVLDGVQDSDQGYMFHFNLGWGGVANGWYNSTNPQGYSSGQDAVINIGAGRMLNVSIVPENAGAVMANPVGTAFVTNATIEVKAMAFGGYVFSHWTGDATGTDKKVSLTMDTDKSITAVFVPGYKICMHYHGEGSVNYSPDADGFNSGTSVTLQAKPASGWIFDHWEGDVTGSNQSATITVNRDQLVHAYFVCCNYLTVVPTGKGTVTRSLEGPGYKAGTRVTLTAEPDSGWVFRKWWGDVDSTEKSIIVTADCNKLIQAEFVNPSLENHSLTVNVIGNGLVYPFGGSFTKDSKVTLTATPAQGWKFVQWRGEIVSKTNPLEITMDQARCVTGVFAEENAQMPADETIQNDQPTSSTDPVGTVQSLFTDSSNTTASTEKGGDFGFSNLIDSCTLLATVLIGFMFYGFGTIRARE